MHIPLNVPMEKRAEGDDRFAPRDSLAIDPALYEELKYQLITRLKKKVDEYELCLVNQMVDGEYVPNHWNRITHLSEEIERLKGAIGMLRFIAGQHDALHLDIEGYIVLRTPSSGGGMGGRRE